MEDMIDYYDLYYIHNFTVWNVSDSIVVMLENFFLFLIFYEEILLSWSTVLWIMLSWKPLNIIIVSLYVDMYMYSLEIGRI